MNKINFLGNFFLPEDFKTTGKIADYQGDF